ncbi:MAG: DUF1849 family protein [Reyranella sp.]|uniref:EipB family protein n=1 Tax=Reyranella sp. TaxID=1929291 RepID=UPI001AC8B967|nr:DUF1849 family protein [Reyranella sp.]MBN9087276.1 DUF1849 family protein [Reyranella sp.]
MIRRAVFLLAMVLGPAAEAGVTSHAVSYEVKLPADAEKGVYAEGTGTYSLTKSCQGWTLGEVYQFGIDKSPGASKQLGDKADRIEERLTATEPLDGAQLAYQARTRLNARNTSATIKATIGPDGGRLRADLGTYKQTSDLPAGTLPPAAARAALVDALLANQPDPIEIKTVEMLRFHKPIVERFQRLPPEQGIPTALPKDLKTSDKDFAKGRVFAVRRRVGDFNEFGDEFWLLHESGAILRRLIKRQNVGLLLEAREVTLFPAPKCD